MNNCGKVNGFRIRALLPPVLILLPVLVVFAYLAKDAFRRREEGKTPHEKVPTSRQSHVTPLNAFTKAEKDALVRSLYQGQAKQRFALAQLSKIPKGGGLAVVTYQISERQPFPKRIEVAKDSILRSVRISNTGSTTVSSVFVAIVSSDGEVSPPFLSLDTLSNSLAGKVRERDRAIALFELVRDYRYHDAAPVSTTLRDPIEVLNGFGYCLCADSAVLYARLASTCGLRSSVVALDGHGTSEVWYDGDWHNYDVDMGFVAFTETAPGFLDVASAQDLKGDLGLVGGMLKEFGHIPGYPGEGEEAVSRYSAILDRTDMWDAMGIGDHKLKATPAMNAYWGAGRKDGEARVSLLTRIVAPQVLLRPHSLCYTLAPGETIEFTNVPSEGPYVQDGKRVNRPVHWANGRMTTRTRACSGERSQVRCPFPITDIRMRDPADSTAVEISFDGVEWVPLAERARVRERLFAFPRYTYLIHMGQPAAEIITVFQNSPFFLGKYPFYRAGETIELRPLIPLDNLPPYEVEVVVEMEQTEGAMGTTRATR